LIFKSATVAASGLILLYTAVFFAVKFGWTNVAGRVDPRSAEFQAARPTVPAAPRWTRGEEWRTLATALRKDRPAIEGAARAAGVSPRLVAAVIVPEQLRLFYSEREIFKQIFAPLKILGNQTQFSWGVAGLKQETAKQIEEHLKDAASSFYLGPTNESLLDFQTDQPDEERFNRLTDDGDHYYSYLYAALFLKQVITQWEKAGFPIHDRPEILATLFNIGFEHSAPKTAPQVGGAVLEIGNEELGFGRLAYEFYYSVELPELTD